MIGYIKGTLIVKNLNHIIVDVQGVGYELIISPSFSSTLGDIDSHVEVVVYTDVKENAITLYGFRNFVEKQAFLLLKKVKGIGSKVGMGILSTMSPQDLMIAIGKEDATALQKIPGIGKKSAERMIVELREQVRAFATDEDTLHHRVEIVRMDSKNCFASTVREDALLALTKLGFSKEVALSAVTQAEEHSASSIKDAGELLKVSLSYLS